MKQIVESTDPKQAQIMHQRSWVRHRKSRAIEGDRTFIFTDGSSRGSYAAVVVRRERAVVHELAGFERPTSTRNVGAELNGAILGLEQTEHGEWIVLVFDYMGVGAWLSGNWRMKDPEVVEKVTRMRKIVAERKLTLAYIHHRGHQMDKSDFTFYNSRADELAEAASHGPVDTIALLDGGGGGGA